MGLAVARLLLARARSLQPTWWREWSADARQGAGSFTLELVRRLARAGKEVSGLLGTSRRGLVRVNLGCGHACCLGWCVL